ncbi:MAG: Fic family protein [Bacteroidia bacterium]
MDRFKAGTYVSQGSYHSFQPTFINREWQFHDPEMQQMLSLADRHLGRLDMFSNYVPNIDLFISMHVLKEATQSSKIEGTQTNIEEALLAREAVPIEKRDDWEEVQNYIAAMHKAIPQLASVPFSSRLIKLAHKTLLQDVRGQHRLPGEFRSSQNWIGGATLQDAVFIPPPHHDVPKLMSDLEKFVHNEKIYVPELIRIGIIHYQFETIHPFLDGNGRIGRLLITLYLVSRNILKQPILYLSDFFERHRQQYYDNLMAVRTNHDMKRWLKFFLTGIIETAKNSITTFEHVLELKNQVELDIQQLGPRAANAQKVLDYLYKRPLIDAQAVSQVTGKSLPTSYTLIEHLEKMGILKEISGSQRGRYYSFERYLDLYR